MVFSCKVVFASRTVSVSPPSLSLLAQCRLPRKGSFYPCGEACVLCRAARRVSDSKSAQHKKSFSEATWIFCMEPICFGVTRGVQPLVRASRASKVAGAFLVLFWHAKENVSGGNAFCKRQKTCPTRNRSAREAIRHFSTQTDTAFRTPGTAVLSDTFLCTQKRTYPVAMLFAKGMKPAPRENTLHGKHPSQAKADLPSPSC